MRLSRRNWSAAAIFLFCVCAFNAASAGPLIGDLNNVANRPAAANPPAVDNSAFGGACGPLRPPLWPNFKARLDQFVMALCYQKQRWPHEAMRRSSEGLHAPYVKLWYSPQIYRWMIFKHRQGPIPDGSVVIKDELLQ